MLVCSTRDADVQAVLALRRREERDRAHLFYAEGVRFACQATDAGAAIEMVVVAPDLLNSPAGQRAARHLRRGGARHLQVSPDVFRVLSLSNSPQGIGVVARQHWQSLEAIRPGRELCWLAHDTVNSPGNLGANLRTSEAVGGAGVFLIGDATDPYEPAAVRASMGAIFLQRFVRTCAVELAEWKRRHGVQLVGTSAQAAMDYRSVTFRRPVVLYLGCEQGGIPREYQDLCDLISIPMVGRTDSLNLSVATGVMLYEVYRQRQAPLAGGRTRDSDILAAAPRRRGNLRRP